MYDHADIIREDIDETIKELENLLIMKQASIPHTVGRANQESVKKAIKLLKHFRP